MTILLNLLSNYWKQILFVLLLVTVVTMGYKHIYNLGVTDTNALWEVKMVKVEEFRSTQISQIEGFSKTTLQQILINNDKTSSDLKLILNKVKGKPLTNVPDCIPSDEFISTYNDIHSRGNKK